MLEILLSLISSSGTFYLIVREKKGRHYLCPPKIEGFVCEYMHILLGIDIQLSQENKGAFLIQDYGTIWKLYTFREFGVLGWVHLTDGETKTNVFQLPNSRTEAEALVPCTPFHNFPFRYAFNKFSAGVSTNFQDLVYSCQEEKGSSKFPCDLVTFDLFFQSPETLRGFTYLWWVCFRKMLRDRNFLVEGPGKELHDLHVA